jgi:hypothetical protein
MPSRITIPSLFLLITIICAAISACSRSKRQEETRLQKEQQPQMVALPSTPALGPPELRPPEPTEAHEAIRRVYGETVFVDPSHPKYFIAGDFNGDDSIDLAVVVRPARGQVAKLNNELANWIRCDPQKVKPPVPQRHGRILLQMVEPTVIEEHDLLLAVIHGYGPEGWRNPQARQSYLLKNAVGDEVKLTQFKEAVKIVGKYKDSPRLRGDVVSQTIDNKHGLLYYTGAKYAWHRLGTTGP